MEHDRLHLYFAGDDTALDLVPMVQMGQAPSAASDSFYFFNRIDSTNRVRLVSYHHPDSPEILIESDGLLDFVRSISSRTFVDSPPGLSFALIVDVSGLSSTAETRRIRPSVIGRRSVGPTTQ